MCLIAFSLKKGRLDLAANRDEFFDRPAQSIHYWGKESGIIGGKDLKAGGTWLGIGNDSKVAFLTNFRDFRNKRDPQISRGDLVKNFLEGDVFPRDYLEMVKTQADKYDGFNLVVGQNNRLFYYSNIGREILALEEGLFGLSNGFLNDPWPKVERVKSILPDLIENKNTQGIFSLFREEKRYKENLPDTGIGQEMEEVLSAAFIRHGNYGSRVTSILSLEKSGEYSLRERTYSLENEILEEKHLYSSKGGSTSTIMSSS